MKVHLADFRTACVLGGLLRTVDVITSNVPGVPIPLYLAGAKMEAQFPFGPRSGAAVNVTLLLVHFTVFRRASRS